MVTAPILQPDPSTLVMELDEAVRQQARTMPQIQGFDVMDGGDFGVNTLLKEAVDAAELVRRLEAVGMGRLNHGPNSAPAATDPQTQLPPSYQRSSSFQAKTWQGASATVLLENFPAAVAVLDRSLCYLACNQQWLTTFQIAADSFKGQSHCDFFPGLHAEWRVMYESGLAGEFRQIGDDLILLPNGSFNPVRWEILPWRESHGLIGGILLSCALTGANGEISLEPASFSFPDAQFPEVPENSLAPSQENGVSSAAANPALNGRSADVREGITVIHSVAGVSETGPIREKLSGLPTVGVNTGPLSQEVFRVPAVRPDPVDSQFRELAEAAPFGMILLDDEARVLYANPQHQSVLGSSVEGAASLSDWLRQAFPGEEDHCRKSLSDWWETVWTRHNSLTCPLRNAEGLVKDIEFRPAPLAGNRLLLTIFDVTDARLDEQAVRSSEARHRGLFSESPAPFVILNAAGHLVDVNAAFESLTGCTRQEIRRSSLADFLPAEALRKLHPSTTGLNEPFSSWLTHRNGATTAVRIAVSFIRGGPAQAGITGCTFMPLAAEEALLGKGPASAQDSLPHATMRASTQPAALAPQEWGEITPDQLFVLDSAGLVIAHNHGRDFVDIVPPAASLHGLLLETALPRLTAPLPLDIMMERLLEAPGNEIRCAFRLSLPGEPQEFAIEARLIRLPSELPSPASPAAFGLTFRDVSHSSRTD